jgi:putative transposase
MAIVSPCSFDGRLHSSIYTLRSRKPSSSADIGRGLALRMDHGTQYLSDHFLNQVRLWGIRLSFGFFQEPETNGVAERFNCTLKEQTIYGRAFQNNEEVKSAVAKFIDTYNEHWL